MKWKVIGLVGIMAVLIAMLLCCGTAMAAGGTYDGIDWDVTDGVLTLGKEGETQMLEARSSRNYRSWPWNGYRERITSVVTNGELVLQGSLGYMFYDFYNCTGLTSLDLSRFNTSQVTDMSHMFDNCKKLTSLDLSGFNTSNVTNMYGIFYNCSSLTSLDVSGWNTSNVANMGAMFYNCSGLTSLDLSGFNTSNVTSMGSMFSDCSGLTSLDVSGFNTSHVTAMSYMFNSCKSLTSLDVSNFNTSNVNSMNSMFGGCSGLTSLDVSNFNTSNVTNMSYMFFYCRGLTSLDVSNFNTSNVTNMQAMFLKSSSLTSLDLSVFDTSNVTDMYVMFQSCSSLTSLDLSNFDTSNVTNMTYMFDGCNSLKEVTIGENNVFIGSGAINTKLPTPPASKDGIRYTQKWIREDRTYGPYTPTELRENYTSEMAGTWVWEAVPTEYTIAFNAASYPTAVGAMPNVTTFATADYTLPSNQFILFGFSFDHWDDGNGHIYADQGTIPANTYTAGASVTLSAVMIQRDTSVTMQDGSFDFSIKGNEKALFQPIHAATSYQVYEQTPFGWNLIKQSNNAGAILPDVESEALFLNQYDPLKVTVRFAGTKLMDESAAASDSFNFLLYEDDTLIDMCWSFVCGYPDE